MEDLLDWDEEPIVLTPEEIALSNQLDRDIKRERILAGVDLTTYIHHRLDLEQYNKAKRRLYYERFKSRHPDRVKAMAKRNYHKHRCNRLQHMKSYYNDNRNEILDQKKSYYQIHKDEILEKRKQAYTPHPREVIDTPAAELKRKRELERYHANKDEINRKRRERRRQKRQGDKEIRNETEICFERWYET